MNNQLTNNAQDRQVMPKLRTLETLPKKTYIDGKEVEETADNYTRIGQAKELLIQLHLALSDRAKEIEALWERGLVPRGFLGEITLIFEQADKAIRSTVEQETVGVPPTLSDARALLLNVNDFEKSVQARNDLSPDCRKWVQELRVDLLHYVRQIEMTYGVVNKAEDGYLRPPNRPINLKTKQAYLKLVQEHQSANGANTFPKPGIARTALAKQGVKVTTRTLGTWRQKLQREILSYPTKKKTGNK